jgi:VanZ family protein
LALLLTLIAGSLDEIHQIFVPSRGPSPYDVMLDMMGALFVQILIASFVRYRPAVTTYG